MSLKASAVPSIFAWKQHETNFTSKAAAPYRKTLSTTLKSGEICPRKSVFLCLRSPAAAKHQKQQAIIALSHRISLALQIKCGLFVHFFAKFKTLDTVESFRQLICNFYNVQCFGETSVCCSNIYYLCLRGFLPEHKT